MNRSVKISGPSRAQLWSVGITYQNVFVLRWSTRFLSLPAFFLALRLFFAVLFTNTIPFCFFSALFVQLPTPMLEYYFLINQRKPDIEISTWPKAFAAYHRSLYIIAQMIYFRSLFVYFLWSLKEMLRWTKSPSAARWRFSGRFSQVNPPGIIIPHHPLRLLDISHQPLIHSLLGTSGFP